MTLSALQKLCDAITCNWTCSNIRCCSNDNPTLILSYPEKATPTAQAALKQQNLSEAMKALAGTKPLALVQASQKQSRYVSESTAAAKAGICGVKQFFAAQLNDPDEELGNGESKRELVFILSNIDDEGRFSCGEALTKTEYDRLQTNADNVKKYYKAASYLRMKVIEADFDFSKLIGENPILTSSLQYFRGKIKLISKDNLKTNKSFWKLENIEQQTLLEASMKIQDPFLQGIADDDNLQVILYSEQEKKGEAKENVNRETDRLTHI